MEINMEKVFVSNNGYEVLVKVTDMLKPQGYKNIEFSTRWNKAEDPDARHYKFSVNLSEAEIDTLKTIL
jgi:hypothetical protein